MSTLQASQSCSGGAPPPPPGDCTPAQHRALQDDVNNKCKGDRRSCRGLNDCAKMLENMQKNWDCAVARETVADTCFRGGDAGHRQAIVEALNAAAYCEQRYNQQCRPRQQPQPDPDFMERMSQITGLTGAALILYLIVSEGSRLFPPRNLVPIP